MPPAAARRAARVWAAQGAVVFPSLLGAAALAPLLAHAQALFHAHNATAGPDLSLTIRQSKQRGLRPLALARGGDALRRIAARLEPFLAEAAPPHAPVAAAPCTCSRRPVHRRLPPCAPEATPLRVRGCSPVHPMLPPDRMY